MELENVLFMIDRAAQERKEEPNGRPFADFRFTLRREFFLAQIKREITCRGGARSCGNILDVRSSVLWVAFRGSDESDIVASAMLCDKCAEPIRNRLSAFPRIVPGAVDSEDAIRTMIANPQSINIEVYDGAEFEKNDIEEALKDEERAQRMKTQKREEAKERKRRGLPEKKLEIWARVILAILAIGEPSTVRFPSNGEPSYRSRCWKMTKNSRRELDSHTGSTGATTIRAMMKEGLLFGYIGGKFSKVSVTPRGREFVSNMIGRAPAELLEYFIGFVNRALLRAGYGGSKQRMIDKMMLRQYSNIVDCVLSNAQEETK